MFAALIPVLGSAIGTLIDRLIPDEHEREKAKLEMEAKLLEAQTAADNAQIEVNKVEAGSSDPFTSRWRPFIGWVGGLALAYNYLLRPLLPWLLDVIAIATGHQPSLPPLPALDGSLMELVLALLGLGGMRTFEKWKGITK